MKFVLPDYDTHFGPWLRPGPGYGHYQRPILYLALGHVQETRVAVDVGAHVGFMACFFAKHFEQVYAFEPQEDNYACLLQNIPANVKPHNLALSDFRGRSGITTPHRESSGAWHLCEGDDVDVIALDDLDLPRVDLLKLDIQGGELAALRGAEQTIARCRPVMVVEMTMTGADPDDEKRLREWLQGVGTRPRARIRRDEVWVFPPAAS